MNRRTTFLIGSFAVAVMCRDLQAQRRETPPKKPARVGVIPTSPPADPVVVNSTGLPLGNTTGTPIPNSTGLTNNFIVQPVVPVVVSYFPTMVLGDGRVLANFGTGRGYEQVLRKCPTFSGAAPTNAYMSPCWTVDGAGRYVVVQQR